MTCFQNVAFTEKSVLLIHDQILRALQTDRETKLYAYLSKMLPIIRDIHNLEQISMSFFKPVSTSRIRQQQALIARFVRVLTELNLKEYWNAENVDYNSTDTIDAILPFEVKCPQCCASMNHDDAIICKDCGVQLSF